MQTKFQRLLIFSGLFNIICASPFALPLISDYYLKLLNQISITFSLGGTLASLPTQGTYAYFLNVAGVHLVLTGTLVLFAAKKPSENKFVFITNAIGRTIFSCIIVFLILNYHISGIWLIFSIMDFIISFFMIYFTLRIPK